MNGSLFTVQSLKFKVQIRILLELQVTRFRALRSAFRV